MSAKANQAICTLYRQTVFVIREFASNRKEITALEDAHFRYCELVRKDLELREILRRRYGLMGVHFPNQFVSERLAKQLSPLDQVSSGEVRKELKLWEILEDFLTVVGETTYSGFCSFMYMLNFDEPSSQAFSSAVKTHPDLFDEGTRDCERTITLKTRA